MPARRIEAVQRAHRVSTRLLAAALFLLGVAMIVMSLARGGGPLAVGILVGLAFAFLGGLRWTQAAPPGRQ
jgi:hypothetical protein